MALIAADRVRNPVDISGTGDATITGTSKGYKSLTEVLADGDTFHYSIVNDDTGEWETGLGTFSAPNIVARTTVSQSSNNNNKVNFAVGRKNIALSFNVEQYDGLAQKQDIPGYFKYNDENVYGPYDWTANAPFPNSNLPSALNGAFSPFYTGAPILGFAANGTYNNSQQIIGMQVDANTFLYSDSDYNAAYVYCDSYYGDIYMTALSKPPYYSLGSCRVTYGGVETTGYLKTNDPVPTTGDNNFYNNQVPNWLYMNKRIAKMFYKETSSTNYNLDFGDTDDGRTILFTSNSPITINIGDVGASLSCRIVQYGTGQITIVPNASLYRTVNLISKNGLKTNGQYSVVEINLIKFDFTPSPLMFTYTLLLTGDLIP